MIRNIADASEQYHNAVNACREVFAAAEREFVEPKGVKAHIEEARRLYAELGDEASAVKEVDNARQWLIGIAGKFLRGAVEFFGDRIYELSYMSLDRDIVENMQARLREYEEAVRVGEASSFEVRLTAYKKLATVVNGARTEQQRRIEHREKLAQERAEREQHERRRRREEEAEADRVRAKQQQEAAEAAAREERAKQFDELFGA
ncbi:MAG: hypothetical protein A3C49_01860 [Candidatus Doudnabacteria bacterium RIFCSPHIGHO2_02_FULL_42_25]|uniref:Uncharacterized protein n=1 Tax=Candidatus Doudnabacteria bacterium RIFCSPHIGHO2_01_FULL_41_86 TaxID=1817821 RepID=A0A1F5N946_9BACT|nr:MAG: hypothetical protein A2717_01455 [Candidatus Doudnabacteria bacterium RIFCSPHIGHO2_01_FULL_41_86]OGE74889.1 MAG: hypothetical protein A3K07_03025 [Candidatus Doudnabacteria bacterium RIFCSPHIGHO2_01_43_10]OGE85235.1 MAG: hypothetical protein A3E28_01025 [Candidatus Doudnabacteria bacterium RIFCSPHIGHO2_12_FULL_42_22]OGE86773.1 MAG: hypothetical protein A3C49_01860 [Candidatus Doudnabacteria bacterium RIFCSPHIGHO2_02_FULL_42_25]OGE92371.1 MAG: hypothetical protein A2895_02015 [Candidatus